MIALRAVIAASLITTILFASTADQSFDRSPASAEPGLRALYQNTKEDRTILINRDEADRARALFSSAPSAVIDAVSEEWFHSFQDDRGACEPVALTRLQQILKNNGLPNDFSDTVSFLAFLRVENRMDDVILFPLWKSGKAWVMMGLDPQGKVQPPGPPPTASGKKPKKSTLKKLYFHGLNEACPTQAFGMYLSRKKSTEKKSYSRSGILLDLQRSSSGKVLSPYLYAWFLELYRSEYDRTPYSLATVLPTYKSSKDVERAPDAPEQEKSPYLTQLVKGEPYTRRMSLYARYNSLQLVELGGLLPIHSMIAFSDELGFTSRTGEKVYHLPLKGVDKYETASMILRFLIQDLSLRESFANPIEFPDLILASMEIGVIDGAAVNASLQIKELWDPTPKSSEKIKKWVRRVLGPAVILIPPPFNMMASIGMVLAEQFILKPEEHEMPVIPGTLR